MVQKGAFNNSPPKSPERKYLDDEKAMGEHRSSSDYNIKNEDTILHKHFHVIDGV